MVFSPNFKAVDLPVCKLLPMQNKISSQKFVRSKKKH